MFWCVGHAIERESPFLCREVVGVIVLGMGFVMVAGFEFTSSEALFLCSLVFVVFGRLLG